ncbi:UNVERIFIED_CONTAM: hypothetical protein Sradi_5249300 [Sesamum radiatum]|uniref:Uncharacterized protein n=1 Tax=Sesamum radiatum TaxID=300843 RepID=A0AAW2LLI7_SESRA
MGRLNGDFELRRWRQCSESTADLGGAAAKARRGLRTASETRACGDKAAVCERICTRTEVEPSGE